jgi:hypothetical protein
MLVVDLTFASLANYFRGKWSSLVSPEAMTEMCQAKIYCAFKDLRTSIYIIFNLLSIFGASAACVVNAAKADGRRLLVHVNTLCAFLTNFSSNDLVIIVLALLIIHIGDHSMIHGVNRLFITVCILSRQTLLLRGCWLGLLKISYGGCVASVLRETLGLWVTMLLPTSAAVVWLRRDL